MCSKRKKRTIGQKTNHQQQQKKKKTNSYDQNNTALKLSPFCLLPKESPLQEEKAGNKRG